MPRNWKFWLAIVALAIFFTIWAMEGFFWAVSTLIIVGVFIIYTLADARRRRSYDIHIHMEDGDRPVTRRPRRSAIQTGLDWHVPKVSKNGIEFITGAKGVRRRDSRVGAA